MSRVTRCPNCETLFKVVPDQLRLSQGWVRCGSCGTVFDASEQMQHPQAHDSASNEGKGLSHPIWSLLLEEAPNNASDDQNPNLEELGYRSANTEKTAKTPAYSENHSVTTTVILTDASFLPEAHEPPTEPASAWSSNWSQVAQGVQPTELSLLDRVPSNDNESALPSAHTPSDLSRPLHEAGTQNPHSDSDPKPDLADTLADADKRLHKHALTEAHNDATGSIGNAQAHDSSVHPLFKKASAETHEEIHAGAPPASEDPAAKRTRTSRKKKSIKPPPLEAFETETKPPNLQRAEDDNLSFVKEAKRRQFWRKPWVRAFGGLASMALLIGLSLKWVHEERDWLAAAYPDTKPMLQSLCGPLKCIIAPYQKLESIAIQQSEFNRLTTGDFQLSLSVRNLDTITLAMPSLTLTLTDALDQTVTQQVLTPAQLKAPSQLLAQRDWSGNLVLSLDHTTNADLISGYRLQAFYP